MDAAGSIIDYIVDGLMAELELERELGVRTVEIDRSLLVQPPKSLSPQVGRMSCPRPQPSKPVAVLRPPPSSIAKSLTPNNRCKIAFLHHCPLSESGMKMMMKIINAMGLTEETAPIVVEPPVPLARITVVLGGLALKKYFPNLNGGPGQWIKTADGRDVLVTYSPAYILRFATITPAVEKIKQDMWRNLKAARQRIEN